MGTGNPGEMKQYHMLNEVVITPDPHRGIEVDQRENEVDPILEHVSRGKEVGRTQENDMIVLIIMLKGIITEREDMIQKIQVTQELIEDLEKIDNIIVEVSLDHVLETGVIEAGKNI